MIFIFLLLILLPESIRQFLNVSDTSRTENRILVPYPVFSIQNVSDFIKQFDLFYNDHFGLRLCFAAAYTFLHANLFGESGIQSAIMGKRGWMFIDEYRPTDPMVLSGWQGYMPYSPEELIAIQKNLEAERLWFAVRNITFLILPVPDKHSIYPEYLPWQFTTPIGASRQAQIFEHMKLHSKVELIDIRETLSSFRKLHRLDTYFKTDSHWNNIGAFLAYNEIMKRLLVVYPQLVPSHLDDFIPDKKLKRQGDLANMVNLDVSHILEHQFITKQNATYSKTGLKKGKILFFGDSFTKYFLAEYFTRHFTDVKYFAYYRNPKAPLDKQIVLTYNPDVVIFESVERNWARPSPHL